MGKSFVERGQLAFQNVVCVQVEAVGAEALNVRPVLLQLVGLDSLPVRARKRIRVQVLDTLGATSPSATATLTTTAGTAVAGNGTSDLVVESDDKGQVGIDLGEPAVANRYLVFLPNLTGPQVQHVSDPFAIAFA